MIVGSAGRTLAGMAMVTVSEAAERHKLSRTHIRRLVADGVLKGKKIGPVWTVDERSLTRYLAAGKWTRRRVPKK